MFRSCLLKVIVCGIAMLSCLDSTACKRTILVDNYRSHFDNDTELLQYIFSRVRNNTKVVLGPREYRINSLYGQKGSLHEKGFIMLSNIKKVDIVGEGTVIIDEAEKQLIGIYPFSFMRLEDCSHVSITGIKYIWKEQCDLHPDVKGIVFIRAMGECRKLNIDIQVENAGRGFYSGTFAYTGNYRRGICDSKIKIGAYKVGYPLAICGKGDNLELECIYNIAHRGAYLGGVTNSKIIVRGKEAYSTRVQLLLTDVSDSEGCWPCDHIDATIEDLGTQLYSNSVLSAVYQFYQKSYECFSNRKPYRIERINIHVYTPDISGTSYEIFQFAGDVKEEDFANVYIDGKLRHRNAGGSRLFRLNRLPQGNVFIRGLNNEYNYILQMEDVPENFSLNVSDCSNIILQEKIQSKICGKLFFKGCTFRGKPSIKGITRNDNFHIEIEE